MHCYFEHVPMRRRRLIRDLLYRTLEISGNFVKHVSVGVRFVSAPEIQALNAVSRGVDAVTDVLSFPMLDIQEPAKLSEFDQERLPNGELFIGDIVLCMQRTKEQAKSYGNCFKRELAFLIVHGYLHLLGYDHIDDAQETRMMNLTENILLNFGLERQDV